MLPKLHSRHWPLPTAQTDLLELQLLDVLGETLLKDSQDLLSSALSTIHSFSKGLLKLAAQAQNQVDHATPAGHWRAPHAAQLLLQTSNTYKRDSRSA